jgi:threonine aldolase
MPIDLRSDTVTLPSEAMRAAMAAAAVGDDQYEEDPTVNSLQDRVAALLGKEKSLFFPSGTMTNQTALNVLTRPGDDVLIGDEAHLVWHETGAAAANSGVQFTVIGNGGLFTAAELLRAVKPRHLPVFPPTTLVVVENTHNRHGGIIFPQPDCTTVVQAAAQAGLGTYLDGARLFNAAAATGLELDVLASGFDLVGVSLSKGLGCPVGSMLAGRAALITAAKRVRRRFGGALRQAGILAAAAHYALSHNLSRLAEDHANARMIAEHLTGIEGVRFDPMTVQTNIIVFHLDDSMPTAATLADQARIQGVLLGVFGERTIRAATHLGVTRAQCREAGEVVRALLSGMAARRQAGSGRV